MAIKELITFTGMWTMNSIKIDQNIYVPVNDFVVLFKRNIIISFQVLPYSFEANLLVAFKIL